MDTQKRIVIWVSVALVLLVTVVGIWQTTTGGTGASGTPRKDTLSEKVLPTDWIKGAQTPKVTLVEYSDFQCPACGYYYPVIEKIFAAHQTDMAFVYRHFPLPQHKNALAAAYATEAAGAQGKFWEMHGKIFDRQTDWAESDTAESTFEGYALELGLDINRFRTDRDSQTTKDNVAHDMETGKLSGVNGTPSFYINGKKIQNPQSVEAFEALIKDAIAND